MRPLRVLHLVSSPKSIGGVERLLLDAAPFFERDGLEVHYANLFTSAPGEDAFSKELRPRSRRYHFIAGRRLYDIPRVVGNVARVIRKHRIDVLHTHMLHATIVGAAVAAATRRRLLVVATRHYMEEGYANHGRAVRHLDEMALRRATHVTGVSTAVVSDLTDRVGLEAERVTLIHNGIDLRPFNDQEHTPMPWRERWESEWVMGMVGSLLPRKGQMDLIDAMGLLRERYPQVRLVIVGEGPDRLSLEGRAAELGVSDRVEFAGFRSGIPDVMRSLNMYVHSAHRETFGISILEAMAASLPVIATKVGGIPDVVMDGESGILVPPHRPQALADAVGRMIEDPTRARRLGRTGRHRVESQFSIESVVQDYRRLYVNLTVRPGTQLRKMDGSVGTRAPGQRG